MVRLTSLKDTTATDAVKAETNSYLEQILPVTLRFMADEYDDTCNTVFPFLQALLTNVSLFLPPRLCRV